MNDNNGFIVIQRKILKWEWYQDINTKILFLHCLLKANWEKGKFQGIEIPRGSFVTSLQKLSAEIGLSTRQVRTSLEHLTKTGELTNKSYSKYRVITINNYSKYQDYDKVTDKQLTSNRQTTDKQSTTIEQEQQEEQEEQEEQNNNNNNIYEFVEQNFGRTLSSLECQEIKTWNDTELTRYAIKQAVISNKCSIKYISRILFAYGRENIKTVQQAQEREREYAEARKKRSKNQLYKAPEPSWLNQEIKREEVVYDEQLQREYEEFERAVKGK